MQAVVECQSCSLTIEHGFGAQTGAPLLRNAQSAKRPKCLCFLKFLGAVQAKHGECMWADGTQRCGSFKVLGLAFVTLCLVSFACTVMVMFLSPSFDHGSKGMRRAGVGVYVSYMLLKIGVICVTILVARNVR